MWPHANLFLLILSSLSNLSLYQCHWFILTMHILTHTYAYICKSTHWPATFTHTSIHLHKYAHICTNICTCTTFKFSFKIVRCILMFAKDIEVILLSRKSANLHITRCKLLGSGLLCVHYSWLISCVSVLWSSFLSGLACPPSTVSWYPVHVLSWLHVSSPVTW